VLALTTRVLPEFTLAIPGTLEEAVSFLAQHRDEASIIAGGTDLLIQMKRRIRKERFLVHIKKISGLNHIQYDDKNRILKIGALTTINQIEKSPLIRDKFPLLWEAAQDFGSVQIRNLATLGGNLCNASPAADMAPPLLVLDGKVKIVSSKGEKIIPLEQFFIGPGKTILEHDDILTEVLVEEPPPRTGTVFLKLAKVKNDSAKINLALKLTLGENDVCKNLGIALGAVAPTPIRVRKAEKKLINKKVCEESIKKIADISAREISPSARERHSTVEYRKEVSKVLVKRGIKTCLRRIKQ